MYLRNRKEGIKRETEEKEDIENSQVADVNLTFLVTT